MTSVSCVSLLPAAEFSVLSQVNRSGAIYRGKAPFHGVGEGSCLHTLTQSSWKQLWKLDNLFHYKRKNNFCRENERDY